MTVTHVLGIDPGLSGALCLYEISTKSIRIFDMPTVDGSVNPAGVASIVEKAKFIADQSMPGTELATIRAAVENVSSMPRQAGAFNFGRSVGVVHGVLGALRIPYELVSPVVWKGAMGLHKTIGESQDQVVAANCVASAQCPGVNDANPR
jgi:hypothetical protein